MNGEKAFMHSVWDLAKTIFIEHDFQYAYVLLPIDLGQNEIEKKKAKYSQMKLSNFLHGCWLLK